jgi:hypothetical protein
VSGFVNKGECERSLSIVNVDDNKWSNVIHKCKSAELLWLDLSVVAAQIACQLDKKPRIFEVLAQRPKESVTIWDARLIFDSKVELVTNVRHNLGCRRVNIDAADKP